MAVPSYTTDLSGSNTLAIGSLTTENWDESSNSLWDDAGSMVDDGNLYYNGTKCVSAQFTKDGVGTIINAYGTGITIPTDGAILMWHMWAAPPALDTKANGGVRILVGDSYEDFEAWIVSGRDIDTPELIWNNHAVNPDIGSPDYTVGSPTIYSYFGTAVKATAQARGNPNAMNAIRYGRCTQIYEYGETSNYCKFSGYGDVDNASANKYGLLRESAGGYLQQGLVSLGTTSNAVDFRDANVNISIANTENVTSGFNRFEVNNASSNVEWTAVSILALGTIAKGNFVVVANAALSKKACTFTDMGYFTYQSNSDITDGTVYRRCGLVTQDGATFTDVTFDQPSGSVCLLVDDLDTITACQFNSDGTGHAVDLGTVSANESVSWGNTEDGYASTNGSTGNETIVANVASGITLTINVATGASTPTVKNLGTGTIAVVSSFSLTLNGIADGTRLVIANSSTRNVLHSVVITASGETTYSHGGGEIVDIMLIGLQYDPNVSDKFDYTLPSGDYTLGFSMLGDINYYNP